MPDEVEYWRPAADRDDARGDLVDDLAAFADGLPAWCGPDGLPRSWRHWVHGCAYLGRAYLRRQQEHAAAARVAAAGSAAEYDEWQRDVARMTRPQKPEA